MRLDVESDIKGYHIYKRSEPENVVARFACSGSGKRRSNSWISKQRSLGRFGKTIFFFVRVNHGNTCQVEVRGKRFNKDDGQGGQVPFTLHFS